MISQREAIGVAVASGTARRPGRTEATAWVRSIASGVICRSDLVSVPRVAAISCSDSPRGVNLEQFQGCGRYCLA